MSATVSYHDNDFDYSEWVEIVSRDFELPPIQIASEDQDGEVDRWQIFYHNHETGLFYKPRRYLCQEFARYLPVNDASSGDTDEFIVLEVGCGHGCSIFPLIGRLSPSTKYIATDFSPQALHIMSQHPRYDESVVTLKCWDITQASEIGMAHVVLCVFVLSAIHPDQHVVVLRNLADTIECGGHILFRDYAEHDMTMYRHKIRLGERLFRRLDGTLAFYFNDEYLRLIATSCELELIECSYATVCVKNRASRVSMNRVFIHVVFKKI